MGARSDVAFTGIFGLSVPHTTTTGRRTLEPTKQTTSRTSRRVAVSLSRLLRRAYKTPTVQPSERVADAGRAPDGIVTTLTVSLSCTGGAARENVVGGAGSGPE